MEEERMSNTITTTESNLNSPSQRPRNSSRFRGVVYQRNGHVGAQIHVKHQRIWLGTFKTDIEAAVAYDRAAIKLQHESSGQLVHLNFPWTALIINEPKFQSQYTTDQVLSMIKDGSYNTKFGEFLRSTSQVCINPQISTRNNGEQEVQFSQEIFRKELTISDVGKLNRFVIPKRYAVKYFPISDTVGRKLGECDGEMDGGGRGCMNLIFYDKTMKRWEFKYYYSISTQSYVLTRGWNNFVRANSLEAKDIVAFFMCELKEKDVEDLKKFWMIKVIKNNAIKVETKRDKGLKLFGVHIVPATSANC